MWTRTVANARLMEKEMELKSASEDVEAGGGAPHHDGCQKREAMETENSAAHPAATHWKQTVPGRVHAIGSIFFRTKSRTTTPNQSDQESQRLGERWAGEGDGPRVLFEEKRADDYD